jgi:Spy/CpxP family protein refolding chaperone
MKPNFVLKTMLAALIATAFGCTSFSSSDGVSANTYAGQQTRQIKALSSSEQQDLLEGRGMGLARAAELNGYPGPMHTLEHARSLDLSDAQAKETKSLMQRHKAAVRALGKRLVDEERNLDEQFAFRTITAQALDAQVSKIALIQAQIRAEHLRTHIEQTALLTKDQINKYNQLRGYSN